MCGIVGYIGPKQATTILVEGLRRLEYRGYDSAGVALLTPLGTDAHTTAAPSEQGSGAYTLQVSRCRGKLAELESLLAKHPTYGQVGIGHTRWATHGRPSDENAHPHCYKTVAVVHNGIIENYLDLKQGLAQQGHHFQSETDTEIIAHLIYQELQLDTDKGTTDRLLAATRRALHRVHGAYAIVVLSTETPDEIICAKNASPLVLGLGEGENFVASDVPALLPHTRRVIFLEEGDLAQVKASGVRIYDLQGNERAQNIRTVTWSVVAAEKAGYKHFMLKEIHEQARAVTDTLRGRLIHQPPDARLDGMELFPKDIRRLFLLACGTSYHAALVGKYMIEQLARIPVEVDLASEFRYRDPIVNPGDWVVAVSQSGETADTLAAIKEARSKGAKIFSITNVLDASIPRASDHAFYTH
ncbi:MAG: glutamine--fructose-6-phosphate transaminase (isomerizing), partial [Deltaproteobacteria bacterium]|nr:glutamine--fructose-6-phosphate transaminase (isomerizing) [Deltaproteobacteria bacterium]